MPDLGQQLFEQLNTIGGQHAQAMSQGNEFILAIRKLKMAEEAQAAALEMQKQAHDLERQKWEAENGLLQQQIKHLTFQNEQATQTVGRQRAAGQALPSLLKEMQAYDAAQAEGNFDAAGKMFQKITGQLFEKDYTPELLQMAVGTQSLFKTAPELIRALRLPTPGSTDIFKTSEMLSGRANMESALIRSASGGKTREDVRAAKKQAEDQMTAKSTVLHSELRSLRDRTGLAFNIDLPVGQTANPNVMAGIMAQLMANQDLPPEVRTRIGAIQKELAPLVETYKTDLLRYDRELDIMDLANRAASTIVGSAFDSAEPGPITEAGAAEKTRAVLLGGTPLMQKLPKLAADFEQLPTVQAILRLPLGDESNTARIDALYLELAQTPGFAELPEQLRGIFVEKLRDERVAARQVELYK